MESLSFQTKNNVLKLHTYIQITASISCSSDVIENGSKIEVDSNDNDKSMSNKDLTHKPLTTLASFAKQLSP